AAMARIFFEWPCIEWILANLVLLDFFYDHCSYFSAASLSTAFQVAGFEVQSVTHVFEGQYLWLEATLPQTAPRIDKRPGTVAAQAQRFAQSEARRKEN